MVSWVTVAVIVVLTAMISGSGGLVIACMLVAGKQADEQMEKAMNTYESN
jgi:hypothetical protein